MKTTNRWAASAALASLLAACGGADSPEPTPSLYVATSAQISNNQEASLASVLAKLDSPRPAITTTGCNGTVDEPVYFSLWVGDYTSLNLNTGFSTDIERVAAMTERQQLLQGTTDKYLTLVNNLSNPDLAGDSSLDLPKGTTEVWYEFYCKVGTISAGKVTL